MARRATSIAAEDFPDAVYASRMTIIKERIRLIDDICNGRRTTGTSAQDVETAALQLRKSLELVAMASLVAHNGVFEDVRREFRQEWRAAKILKSIEARHPHFFPRPIENGDFANTEDPSGPRMFREKPVGTYMSKAQLIEVHGRLGDWLHAANPLSHIGVGGSEDLAQLQTWRNSLVSLLNCHLVWFHGGGELVRVVMHTVGGNAVADGEVSVQRWQRGEPVEIAPF